MGEVEGREDGGGWREGSKEEVGGRKEGEGWRERGRVRLEAVSQDGHEGS